MVYSCVAVLARQQSEQESKNARRLEDARLSPKQRTAIIQTEDVIGIRFNYNPQRQQPAAPLQEGRASCPLLRLFDLVTVHQNSKKEQA